MNRRQWKKACRKAAEQIKKEFPNEVQIDIADGTETIDAPSKYEPPYRGRNARLERRYTSIPRGAPMIWERWSYEYDEWEPVTALQWYRKRRFVEDHDWEAESKRLGHD